MPLVEKNWKQYGLKSWKVLKFEGDVPYSVQATLEWDSMDDYQKAVQAPETKEVLGDVENFSDKGPILMASNVVGTS